jgi:hypothetical protein
VKTLLAFCLGSALVGSAAWMRPAAAPTTPEDLVATYNSLADGILALNKTETNVCNAILTHAFKRAEDETNKAMAKVKAGQPAKEEIEAAAAYIGMLANEGDTAVAGIRKRLVEGGHNHNAAGEAQGIFATGFVVVTKEATKAFLASAAEYGKMAGAPTADGLAAAWSKLAGRYGELRKTGR